MDASFGRGAICEAAVPIELCLLDLSGRVLTDGSLLPGPLLPFAQLMFEDPIEGGPRAAVPSQVTCRLDLLIIDRASPRAVSELLHS